MIQIRMCIVASALTFMVSGCGSGGDMPSTAIHSAKSRAAISRYRSYLEENTKILTHWTTTILAKIDEGSVTKAQSRYAAALVPYGHIEPVAKMFPSLNARIDSAGGASPNEHLGLRSIEKGLWLAETTAHLAPIAKRLLADVEMLRRKVAVAHLQPASILDGATAVLEKTSTVGAFGLDEHYSHIDLIDVAAELEGADAGFHAVGPILAKEDPELNAEIQRQFKVAYAKVGEYGTLARESEQLYAREPGITFVVADELSEKEQREIARPISALADLLTQAKAQFD
jgi:iron uptake system component EfeO